MATSVSNLFLANGFYSGGVTAGQPEPHGQGEWQSAISEDYLTGNFVQGKLQAGFGRCELRDRTIYVGAFQKGKPNGEGKIFNRQGEVLFDGEMREGTANSGAANQLPFANDFFTGVLLNGKPLGEGRLKGGNGDVYVGCFEKNLPHGIGKVLNVRDEVLFKGKMREGVCDSGMLERMPLGDNLFTGRIENGMTHGFGRLFDHQGSILLQGTFQNSQLWDGEGRERFEWEGQEGWYTGFFKNGTWHGKGQLVLDNGTIVFQGAFHYGDFQEGVGQEPFFWNEEKYVYRGPFKDGKREGIGQVRNGDGQMIFQGLFKKGKPATGEGVCFLKEGSVYLGRVVNGQGSAFAGGIYTNDSL